MSPKVSKSLTESGLKNIYQYFILHFILIFALLIASVGLSLTGQDLLSISASKFYFVVAVVFLFIMIFIWLIWGVACVLNGRREFSESHESNVVMGTILIVVFVVLYFVNLSIAQGFTGGIAFVAAASAGFSSSILLQFVVVTVLSVVSNLLLGLALIYFVRELIPEEKKRN